jgi:hypothetical protein
MYSNLFHLSPAQRTDVLHSMPEHHLMENLSSSHAHEAVIHLRLLFERLERVHIAKTRVIAVECRTGHRTLSCRRCSGLRCSF